MGQSTRKAAAADSCKAEVQPFRPAAEPHNEENARAFIPIDAPVDLPLRQPVAELQAGDLFGEMTCMNYYPRSATVRAKTDCTVLEMLRNVLDILQRNKTFRDKVEQNYRKRALEGHLRSHPDLRVRLRRNSLSYLRDRIELRRYSPGQVICRKARHPTVSSWSARLCERSHRRIRAATWCWAMSAAPASSAKCRCSEAGARTATCTALDHVEAVRIRADEFRRCSSSFPRSSTALRNCAAATAENRARHHECAQRPD